MNASFNGQKFFSKKSTDFGGTPRPPERSKTVFMVFQSFPYSLQCGICVRQRFWFVSQWSPKSFLQYTSSLIFFRNIPIYQMTRNHSPSASQICYWHLLFELAITFLKCPFSLASNQLTRMPYSSSSSSSSTQKIRVALAHLANTAHYHPLSLALSSRPMMNMRTICRIWCVRCLPPVC